MRDKLIERILLLCAMSAVGTLALIALFIAREGLPVFVNHGVLNMIAGATWAPTKGQFGLLPMIAGSAMVTVGALLMGVPLGLACAVTLAELASKKWRRLLKPMIELLAGIPSVVYGFIGMELLVPFIREQAWLGGSGYSALAASILLAIMVLPTIIGISIDAIEAVPRAYRDGSYALGATQWQTIVGVVLPAARTGIVAGVILGMGRAVGETMAVIMVAGNSVLIPGSLLDPVRTLTANIALEMGYASGEHEQALFATGIVLFVVTLGLNALAGRARRTGHT
ncbi:phosphate ABC transporter permease subunit PstC [Gemmatimonas phototrophica]|uniref:Phosphate transport system permease protein n=1 Tax=Gemmatimonas phototrophica TaxID=1379270 RepID=A0A143BKQ4_9BACT|nr:phosphate ABC transporter permease subunit PstC [Gemmatimonas phototrophica]AMW05647.1 phosphate ABC transporter permease [Gemmatimonas phototrophica]